eukprot:augustus_masked-scaffold_14-processed-gene-2.5-mRNA-1 protein AED:0.11 eAED:1.00 QI:0/-1/0/1/-1/1/1/0/313
MTNHGEPGQPQANEGVSGDQWSQYGTPLTFTLPVSISDGIRAALDSFRVQQQHRRQMGEHFAQKEGHRRHFGHGRGSRRHGRGRGPERGPPGPGLEGLLLPMMPFLMNGLLSGQNRGPNGPRRRGMNRQNSKRQCNQRNKATKRGKTWKKGKHGSKRGIGGKKYQLGPDAELEVKFTQKETIKGSEKENKSPEEVLENLENKIEIEEKVEVVEETKEEVQNETAQGEDVQNSPIDLNALMPLLNFGLNMAQAAMNNQENRNQDHAAAQEEEGNNDNEEEEENIPVQDANEQPLTQEELLQMFNQLKLFDQNRQ